MSSRTTTAHAPRDETPRDSRDFLAGGGEMGERMRALDWSRTPLGPVADWPGSLRTAVSMLLPSRAQIVLFWGPEFVVLYNDAYRPVFGAKHPGALGLPGREAWSEIWHRVLHDLLAGVVATGNAFWGSDLEFVLERHGFPEQTYFDVSYDPVRDESGRVAGVYCIVTETTGRVVGERRLALLRDLAACCADARTAAEACARATEVLGAHPDEVPFALTYLDGALQAETPGASTARALTGPLEVREIAIPTTSHDARLVVGLNAYRPFDDKYRSFLELVAGQLGTAISNADAYHAERRRAEAFAELDRAKTMFFSNVSHEFRTPLTLMLGPVEDLLAKAEGDERAVLATVHRNGQRLLKLVNTLLDFARIEAGRAQAHYEPADLAALTSDLASTFRSACERAGLVLHVDCDALPEPVFVDREMWEKIVLNLVSNAFKFTFDGAIGVALRDAGDRVRLTVSDTGTGIPAAQLDRVFDRFHRVEGARGRSHEGSGIGLALVQEMVRLHGGRIMAASGDGTGTTFTVELPKGNRHLPADRVGGPGDAVPPPSRAGAYVSEALGWLASGDAAADAPPVSPAGAAHVLLVDDNADLREYAARLLREHYDVAAVADGHAALAAARERTPDLVVTDVMMPGLDGFGLIRELRADPALASVPVLVLSARAGEEARLEGLNRGADDYLVKPFTARELLVHTGALLQASDARLRALDALRESERNFRLLFESMDEGYCVIEVLFDGAGHAVDFRYLETNPAFEHQTGLKDARGRWMRELLPHHEQHWFDTYGRVAKTGETLRFENEAAALGRWYDVCAFRIGTPELRRVGVVFNDITRRKRDEQALREADRRKDEFLATLSHELRNPLAPLRNALCSMALDPADPGRVAQAREIMERQLNHLVRLVDDLLETARIHRGTLALRREHVELGAIVRHAVEAGAPRLHAARHRLEVALPREPMWLEGDPVRLAQILTNLLDNAAKYTPDGGVIGVEAIRTGRHASIAVRDTGIGIAAEALPRIFDMFTRERRGDGHEHDGLGIGLSLARRLAELHGGTVQAHSAGPGRGSTFTVRLPLVAAPEPNGNGVHEAQGLGPMRVLVVDDNRDAAISLGMVLGQLGADVRVAHDGAAAIEAFSACVPAVVLLDIGMPGMDGYAVARALRERDPSRRATLVALTGWGQEEDRRRARDAGFDHHLVKPAEIAALQQLLAGLAARESPAGAT